MLETEQLDTKPLWQSLVGRVLSEKDLIALYMTAYDHGRTRKSSIYADVERYFEARGMDMLSQRTREQLPSPDSLADIWATWAHDQAKAHRKGGCTVSDRYLHNSYDDALKENVALKADVARREAELVRVQKSLQLLVAVALDVVADAALLPVDDPFSQPVRNSVECLRIRLAGATSDAALLEKNNEDNWTDEARQAVVDVENKFGIAVVSSEHHNSWVDRIVLRNERIKELQEQLAAANIKIKILEAQIPVEFEPEEGDADYDGDN
jgi:hypothetical protein